MGPADDDSSVGGVTWLEIFVLLDITGARAAAGVHLKSPDAARRADARKTKKTKILSNMQNARSADAISLPTLNEELRAFKAIVRGITRHEATHEDGLPFKAEKRDHIRRLADLGILAHQPAIVAYTHVTDIERDNGTRCILQQKIGANPKAFWILDQHITEIEEGRGLSAPGQNHANAILINKNQITFNHVIKWRREISGLTEQAGNVILVDTPTKHYNSPKGYMHRLRPHERYQGDAASNHQGLL